MIDIIVSTSEDLVVFIMLTVKQLMGTYKRKLCELRYIHFLRDQKTQN